MPPWMLAVAEMHPRGLDRQGRGRSQWRRASPEMRPGSHHDGWAATPQAANQPHKVRRDSVAAWLLPVANFRDNLVRTDYECA